jgi:hypothetical protein
VYIFYFSTLKHSTVASCKRVKLRTKVYWPFGWSYSWLFFVGDSAFQYYLRNLRINVYSIASFCVNLKAIFVSQNSFCFFDYFTLNLSCNFPSVSTLWKMRREIEFEVWEEKYNKKNNNNKIQNLLCNIIITKYLKKVHSFHSIWTYLVVVWGEKWWANEFESNNVMEIVIMNN